MATTLATLAMVVAMSTTGGIHPRHSGGQIMPPGPGYGWGFPNGNPDGYGWWDHGTALPIGGDRTPEYFFPRYFALPANQIFLPNYYNAYVTRGQRYIPYVNCGGAHPMGGPAPASAHLPVHPGLDAARSQPVVTPPRYTGRVEAPPVNPGGSGLTP